MAPSTCVEKGGEGVRCLVCNVRRVKKNLGGGMRRGSRSWHGAAVETRGQTVRKEWGWVIYKRQGH